LKHALWLRLLARLTADAPPLTVIDTHAGAGLYDLQDAMAQRSKESEAGIVRLMADKQAPEVFAALKAAVAAENPDGRLRFYPGSPLLTVQALRRGDRYVGCELREDDQAALQTLLDRRATMGAGAQARAVLADGYGELGGGADGRRRATIIDPPFERGDEYAQIIDGVARALAADASAVIAIWTPLKDLETFDFLLRGLEAIDPPSLLVTEARLRPLMDPMKMNGTAMIFVNAEGLEPDARAAAEWVVEVCGERGGKAQVRNLVGR
jgi:23S rRNA (adenine2030-N6)-methyltransferase